MEELLKQVLESQLTMASQIVKIQENQIEMMKQINERFEKLEKKFDTKLLNVENKLSTFKKETEERFIKLEKKLDENLIDIAFIFEKYDQRFMEANKAKRIN